MAIIFMQFNQNFLYVYKNYNLILAQETGANWKSLTRIFYFSLFIYLCRNHH